MAFDWETFLDKTNHVAVHCKTKEEADGFCKHMHEHGLTYSSGVSYLLDTYYDVYQEATCYSNHGDYCSYNSYKSHNYKIHEWGDYQGGKFTKSDLKDFMLVKLRNGQYRLVFVSQDMLFSKGAYTSIFGYDEIMLNTYDASYDIMEVYSAPDSFTMYLHVSPVGRKLLYEREKIEEMTLEEVCKALGKQIKIIEQENVYHCRAPPGECGLKRRQNY